MFYCDACQKRNDWPSGFSRSFGPCEVCGKRASCCDVPSSWLPEPKKTDAQDDAISALKNWNG